MKLRKYVKSTVSALLGLILAVSLALACSLSSGAVNESKPQTTSLTEATDVYWYVSGNKLLLSSELGNSGFYRWSKESISSVLNAAHVPWNSSRSSISEVIIYSPIAPPSTAFWFTDTELQAFSPYYDGELFLDMSFVQDASRMFAGCTSLKTVELASAPAVTNIESIFDSCSSLEALDITFLKSAPLTNMINAFYSCSSLKSLDLTGLDISRITDLTGVFQKCSSLKSLDLSPLNGGAVTNFENTFNGCEALVTLNLGESLGSGKLTTLKNTFSGCKSLTSLDLRSFNTAKVTDMSYAFNSCHALTEILFGEGFICSSVTDMERTFASCRALTSLDTSGWNATGVENMSALFAGCHALSSLDLSGFAGARPTEVNSMFSNAQSLKTVDLSKIDTSRVTSLYNFFSECSSLEGFDLSSINTSLVTNMSGLFKSCTSITSFSFAGVDTSSLTNMYAMFNGCGSLTSIDFTGIDTTKVTDMTSLLAYCSSLEEIDFSDLDFTVGLTSASNILRNCSKIRLIKAPKAVAEGISIPLSYTFYTGTEEINAITSAHNNAKLARKFEISYFWKNGYQTTSYTLSPSFYYYGYSDVSITESISADGYIFGGWTASGSDELVTTVKSGTGKNVSLYAKMTPIKPAIPTITESDDVLITYGEEISVNVSFTKEESHTYHTYWYRTDKKVNTGGTEVSDARLKLGFTVAPFRFMYGLEIEKESYFYCVIKVTRTDNGLTAEVRSEPIRVYVKRAQAEITVHPTVIDGLIYNGSAQAVTAGGETNNSSVWIVYSFSEDGDFTWSNKVTDAGSGTIYYKTEDDPNYISSPVYSLTYTVTQATPTLTFEGGDVTVDYTGSSPTVTPPTVTLLNGEIYSGIIDYSYTGTAVGTGLPANAGTYTVTASIKAAGNYAAAESSNSFTLTINKIAPNLTEAPSAVDSLVYNGKNTPLVTPGTVTGGVIEYSLDGTFWENSPPTGKSCGEYTVYYRVLGDENHTDGESGQLTVNIAKATLTVSATDTVVCLGCEMPTLGYTLTGLFEGDTLITPPSVLTSANINTAGEYEITVSGALATDNYTVVYESGTLTVTPHDWDSGKITDAPSCTKDGKLTYTCRHDENHTYTEDVAKLDHEFDNDCDAECNTCGAVREVGQHTDEDKNLICDKCATTLPSKAPVGAIVGIATGSLAALSLIVALVIFIIKKKQIDSVI